MLYYILPLPVFLAAFLYTRREKFDAASIALILAAIGLYYFHFYHAQWNEFTVDASTHAEYVEYIAHHNALPPSNTNPATRHPPAFYLMAAALYKLGDYEQQNNPLLMARHVSMACFVVFILMSVNLLRLLFPNPSGGYYSSLMLLLFWPIGVTMGSRITCDILLYAAEAGVLYTLVRWLRMNTTESLSAAFVWSGIAVLAKSSGIIVLAVTAAVFFLAMIERRRNLRGLLRRDLFGAILLAFICCLLTFTREHGSWAKATIVSQQLYLAPLAWWHMFGSFNVFLFVFDSNMGLSGESFWNMLLHSLMLGNGAMVWKAVYIPIVFNIMWLAIIGYFLEGMLRFGRQLVQEKRVCLLLASFMFIMIFSVMVIRMLINNVDYSDARYIYPVVTVVALCHGKVMERHLKAGNIRAYRLGMGIAFSFLLLTPALFLVQYWDRLF